ncbi:MAG: two-component system regulatory protein YycI [Alicyclobacillaceae bacterium]|nr:two-component system regulatory protein YycI [Alicyclobacillaceae bacterium]
MNWETAKTWLIGMFLILDALLGWQLLQSRREMMGYAESYADRLANTKTLLAESGFILKAAVPSGHPDMPSLHGRWARPAMADLARCAFPGAKRPAVSAAGMVSTPDGILRLSGPGQWTVAYARPPQLGTDVSSVASYIWRAADYAPDPAGGDAGDVVMFQRYHGYPVFDAQVDLQIKQRRLQSYTQTAVVDMVLAGDPKPVIPALQALANLAGAVDRLNPNPDNEIVRVDLGYARKVSVAAGTNADTSDYWFPVWRVATTFGDYYINAFSGEVEATP